MFNEFSLEQKILYNVYIIDHLCATLYTVVSNCVLYKSQYGLPGTQYLIGTTYNIRRIYTNDYESYINDSSNLLNII